MLSNLIKTIEMNKLSQKVFPKVLDWSNLSSDLPDNTLCDIVLGADIFYSGEDFDPILSMVSKIFARNKNCLFITAYQERSSSRYLSPLLIKYEMKANYLPSDMFLHSLHFSKVSRSATNNIEFLNFDSIHMIQIEFNH